MFRDFYGDIFFDMVIDFFGVFFNYERVKIVDIYVFIIRKVVFYFFEESF